MLRTCSFTPLVSPFVLLLETVQCCLDYFNTPFFAPLFALSLVMDCICNRYYSQLHSQLPSNGYGPLNFSCPSSALPCSSRPSLYCFAASGLPAFFVCLLSFWCGIQLYFTFILSVFLRVCVPRSNHFSTLPMRLLLVSQFSNRFLLPFSSAPMTSVFFYYF